LVNADGEDEKAKPQKKAKKEVFAPKPTAPTPPDEKGWVIHPFSPDSALIYK
jgi:hypothetical protein